MDPQPQADLVPNLSPLQQIAAGMIAAGQSLTYIATELGISRLTLHRWKKNPEFQSYLGSLVREANDAAVFKLRQMVGTALDVVIDAMTGGSDVPWHARLKAAGMVLEMARELPPLPTDERSRPQAIPPETIRLIKEQIYGIYEVDPEPDPPDLDIERPDSLG